jgi:hypothetical protein
MFSGLTSFECKRRSFYDPLYQEFTINLIWGKVYMDCLAVVYRRRSLTAIHFNPVLLLGMKKKETIAGAGPNKLGSLQSN